MPQSGLSIGSDARLDISMPTGTLTLPTLLSFKSHPTPHDIKVNPLNGGPIPLEFANGWMGSFDVARADSTVDDFFAMKEAAQYAGANIAPGTIHQTIAEVNGTISQYMYSGVILILKDAGEWKALSDVTQHIEFMATTKEKIL
ncbi:MAG: hypothetical protein ACYC4K_01220 [Thiobacillus sp.]